MADAQFTCEICGDDFDQKSRFEKHMATSHPERAPSAADLERVLAGTWYPKTREEFVDYTSVKVSDEDLMGRIKSLPSRIYRDYAEVAIALREIKCRQVRTAEEAARTEASSVKGGRAATTGGAVSAAAVAKALYGVDFPKRKEELRQYAQRHAQEIEIKEPEAVLNVIDRLLTENIRTWQM